MDIGRKKGRKSICESKWMANCLAKTFQIITVVYSGRTLAFLSLPNQPVKCTPRNIQWHKMWTQQRQPATHSTTQSMCNDDKDKVQIPSKYFCHFSVCVCVESIRNCRNACSSSLSWASELSAFAFAPNRRQKIDNKTNGFFDFLLQRTISTVLLIFITLFSIYYVPFFCAPASTVHWRRASVIQAQARRIVADKTKKQAAAAVQQVARFRRAWNDNDR